MRRFLTMRAKLGRPSYEDWSAEAVDYLSIAFPNPTRHGCPPPESIRRAASSTDVVAGDVRTHLFQCSDCFRDFRAARSAYVSSLESVGKRTIRIGWRGAVLAAAASLVLIAGIALDRLGRPRYSSAAPAVGPFVAADAPRPSTAVDAQESIGRVRIALQPGLVRRGTPERIESRAPTIAVQPVATRFEIQLPEDYQGGTYRIAIVTPFDVVLAEATAVAAAHVLTAVLDGSRVPAGRFFLRVEYGGQPPDYVPIAVGQP